MCKTCNGCFTVQHGLYGKTLLENKTLVFFLSLQGSLTELNKKKKCFVHKKAANTSVNTRNWCLILPCCEIKKISDR